MNNELIKRAEGWLAESPLSTNQITRPIVEDLLTALKGKGWQDILKPIIIKAVKDYPFDKTTKAGEFPEYLAAKIEDALTPPNEVSDDQ
jgi:hypothetical protein